MAAQSRIVDPVVGEVVLVESLRARRVAIAIKATGEVRLTYPKGYDKAHALRFMESKREFILKAKAKYELKREANPPATSYDVTELRAKAVNHLPSRIDHICAQTNFKYNRLTIGSARTRWGSCSSENNITLSIYMMILPQHLIDFIIIHELCHTIHHNHSAEFHRLVNYVTNSREKEFEKELKKYSIR